MMRLTPCEEPSWWGTSNCSIPSTFFPRRARWKRVALPMPPTPITITSYATGLSPLAPTRSRASRRSGASRRRGRALEPGLPPLGGGLRRIAPETGRLDALDGAVLVAVGGVAADADRPDGPAVAVQDEDAARHRDELPLRGGGHRALERGTILQTVPDRARRDAHPERPTGLPLGDPHPEGAAAVVTLERDDLPAAVHDDDGEREHLLAPAGRDGAGGDGGGLLRGEGRDDVAKGHGGSLLSRWTARATARASGRGGGRSFVGSFRGHVA